MTIWQEFKSEFASLDLFDRACTVVFIAILVLGVPAAVVMLIVGEGA